MPMMGARSKLVLMKLGYDLRRVFDDTFRATVPRSIAKRLDRLPGSRDVEKPAEPANARPRLVDDERPIF